MLIDLIKTHALAAAQAGDWAAVASTLNVQTVEVRNPKSWTMADLISLLGAESAAVIGGTIQAAGVSNPIFAGAWLALNITGLQLHTDERQAMIAGLAAGWPAGLKAAALAAGLTYTSLAGETVTEEQCEAAWTTHTAETTEVFHELLLSVNISRSGTITALRTTAVNMVGDTEKSREQPVNMIAGQIVSEAAKDCIDAINTAVAKYMRTLE